MAQDPRKANVSLQKASLESRRFPTIAITTPAEGFDNPEDVETSSNPEASKKLQKLVSSGLNPLKPLIIANTEFVPVGDGSNPDSTGLKVELGENNLLSVNSVTKLFEIHRQVRMATINSADYLLDRIKGFKSEEVLDGLRQRLDVSFEDLIGDTLEKTVDNVIENMYGGNYRKNSFEKNTKKSKRLASRLNRSKKGKENKNRSSKTSGGVVSEMLTEEAKLVLFENQEFINIFKTHKTDPYLRTLVERVILEKIVYDVLQYMSGILSLKDAALTKWSIYESLDFKKSNSQEFDDNINKMLDLAFSLRPYSGVGAAFTSVQDFSIILETFTGIKASSSTPDTSLLIQFFLLAADSFLRQRSIMSEIIDKKDNEELIVGRYPVYDDRPDVKKSLEILKSGKLKGIYTNLNAGDDDYFVPSDYKNEDKSFRVNMVEKLYDSFPSEMDKIDIHGELLASSIFGDCVEIASSIAGSNKKASAFNTLNQGIPSGISSVEDYFKELLDFDKDVSLSNTVYKYNLRRANNNSSRLIRYMSAKSSKSEDLSDYIPLESTTNHKGLSYLTGPEYFYDISLQRGDENLKDFKKFAEEYNEFTLNYISDIYEMTKFDYAVPAAKKLLLKIGEEMSDSAVDGSMDVFLLSLIAFNGGTEGGLLRLFKSIYSASRFQSVKGKEGDGVGEIYDNEDPVTSQQGSRRAMRVANQKLVKRFLKDAANISDSFRSRNNKSGLDFRGNMMNSSIRPKEYFETDGNFSKVENGKTVSPGTAEENSRRIKYKIHKQSGDNFGTPVGGLNKELTALEGGPNISYRSETSCPSFKYFLNNEYFEDAGLVSKSQRDTFNSRRQNIGRNTYREIEGIDYQGTGVSLASHHRLFLLYSFIARIINKSARVYVKSFNNSGGNNSRIEIWMSGGEIEGIAEAFKNIGSDRSSSNFNNWALDKQTAYLNTVDHLKKFLSVLTKKINNASLAVVAPALHGVSIYNQYSRAVKFVKEGNGSDRTKLGIKVLKDRKIRGFDNCLDLLSDEGVSQIYKSYTTTLLSPAKTSYSQEDVPNLNQIKLMMKILTTSGYGLLSSEKRGPKNICHVGVTNSLLSTLRYEAYKSFRDKRFLETRKFCVNIFKRNEIDSQILVHPKTYLFDSSLMVIDNNYLGEDLNHIKNFSDTWTINQIIDNTEFTQWIRTNTDDDPFANLSSAFQPVFKKGSELKNKYGEDILINHIFDYAFKVYYRYALGLDLNENTFTLSPIRNASGSVKGGLTSNLSDIQLDYENLVNQTRLLYPAANVDQKLSSEIFRAIEIIAANPGYSLTDKIKKIIYPKKFDRIYSILVNEKDFVLYTDAYDKEFSDVFKTSPNFSYTSKIYRPEVKSAGFRKDKNISKYIAECDEDFPEIFSMYASITILPE